MNGVSRSPITSLTVKLGKVGVINHCVRGILLQLNARSDIRHTVVTAFLRHFLTMLIIYFGYGSLYTPLVTFIAPQITSATSKVTLTSPVLYQKGFF